MNPRDHPVDTRQSECFDAGLKVTIFLVGEIKYRFVLGLAGQETERWKDMRFVRNDKGE